MGDNYIRNSPQKLGLDNVLLIEFGSHHMVALTTDGVYSWGSNPDGELGLGDRYTREYLPKKINLEWKVNTSHIISLKCGEFFTMFLTNMGELFVCGSIGDLAEKQCVFQKVNFSQFIISFDCGYDHVIIITREGKCYSCGDNHRGQLCLGDTKNRSALTLIKF